jgi:ATP-dependent DNA helicase RecQ
LNYFGEAFGSVEQEDSYNCGSCDNCLSPREEFDGTVIAQKFLSCVIRIRQKSHFSVGLNHVVDVLCGAETEKIRRWGHEALSTYGIGRDHTRTEWTHFGRELLRLNLIEQEPTHKTLALTALGREVLQTQSVVSMRKPLFTVKLSTEKRQKQLRSTGQINYDSTVFERLRSWRHQLAKSRGIPPYVIFHDKTLQQIAATKPSTLEELSRVSGVGAHKLSQYGERLLEVVTNAD